MRLFLIALSAVIAAGPVAALHEGGNPPGQVAKDNPDDISDRNGNGKANGGDYSPGYSASVGEDRNGDGRTNGKDYAPGRHDKK
ncbi:MAG: hypothetical protein RID15_00580 [Marinovum algicola]|uniref:Uncharacterized protein n=1 Tax=Marinovum algicola TaxID=42444 RepID=A0A975W9I3_9RHOB|nr:MULTISPECIES: hypothetical protein [Marinovum]AKO97982.1 hypothetical protein MALG_02828 [Marinovum algicola DG 898]MDD9741895.1 hypothetical protein [Marinovum sp. SP66]MDD9744985.1 hypothetical protein [Marinovum sp. PR37]SEJ36794.1 hypothetical protein SAMN04487940_105128 [Marinovum algicola]SLN39231.1 hypothetical protein MAA5396_01875 [Marinovum algicola]